MKCLVTKLAVEIQNEGLGTLYNVETELTGEVMNGYLDASGNIKQAGDGFRLHRFEISQLKGQLFVIIPFVNTGYAAWAIMSSSSVVKFKTNGVNAHEIINLNEIANAKYLYVAEVPGSNTTGLIPKVYHESSAWVPAVRLIELESKYIGTNGVGNMAAYAVTYVDLYGVEGNFEIAYNGNDKTNNSLSIAVINENPVAMEVKGNYPALGAKISIPASGRTFNLVGITRKSTEGQNVISVSEK